MLTNPEKLLHGSYFLILMLTTPLLQAQEGVVLAAGTADAGAVYAGDTGLYQNASDPLAMFYLTAMAALALRRLN